jgi:hypothetical protein
MPKCCLDESSNLLAGGGYEPTTFDVVQAYRYLLEAAGRCGRTVWAEEELDRLIERGASPGLLKSWGWG